jgi:hypothetical protein
MTGIGCVIATKKRQRYVRLVGVSGSSWPILDIPNFWKHWNEDVAADLFICMRKEHVKQSNKILLLKGKYNAN